jgi:hypothetical protein
MTTEDQESADGDKAQSDLLCKGHDGKNVYLYVTKKE